MNRVIRAWAATVSLAAAASCPALNAYAVDTIYTDTEMLACGPVEFARLNDYRYRSSQELRWRFEENKRYHYDPAVERMRAGEYSRQVMADLDFTLKRWPNHALTLQALIEYELAGGMKYEFLPPYCYFVRARQFAPDDISVALLQAFRFSRVGDVQRAKQSYELVLTLDPASPEAHYNLGLLHVETRNFEAAVEHARKAYGAGFPLPGLRRRLQRAGYSLD